MSESNWIDELIADRSVRKYVAYAGEVEFRKASEADNIGRAVRFRLVPLPENQGKAHPFSKFTRRRKGKTGSRFEASFAQIDGPMELMLEIVLLNWASNPQGDTVDFLLDQAAEHHPFMGCTRSSKETAGTRFMVTVIEKDDSEQLIREEKQERLERARKTGRSQTLSNVARIMTKNTRFWDWLKETVEDTDWKTQDADDWLKSTLGIISKADLDSEGPEAVKPIVAFHRIRQAFVDWQEINGYGDDQQ
jgi:hypothetical protein